MLDNVALAIPPGGGECCGRPALVAASGGFPEAGGPDWEPIAPRVIRSTVPDPRIVPPTMASLVSMSDDARSESMGDRRWIVRPVRDDEFAPWSNLFRGYADFYHWELGETQVTAIWSWIHVEHLIEALVAVESDESGLERGPLVGLAHLRTWVRPLRGTVNGYLDDLFVLPELRGTGVVDAIFRELDAVAVRRGWPVIRWTTAEDNLRAQSVYDRYASRTTWVTYDMDVGPSGPGGKS